MAIIGIDLGTSNSLIAQWTPKGAELIPNALGQYLTPSAVSILEDGSVVVGRAALERLITNPDRTVASFKRWMGTDHQIELANRSWRAEELSAVVLKSLKADAEAILHEEIQDVIISVPAYFSDPQRKATINAGQLAGLNVVRLINEPTAAALAHGLEEVSDGQFLVLDLGGGTFDVSLLNKFDGVMEIRASSGDAKLGGNDFRDGLLEYLLGTNGLNWNKLAPFGKARLLKEADKLKSELSSQPQVAYDIELPEAHLKGSITRQDAEEKWAPLIGRLRKPIERVIRDARVDPSQIDQIVLVGGASRMPLLRNLSTRLFGRFPLSDSKPDHAIAIGAAIQAGLHVRDDALDDIIMTDVCPFTLGIAVLESVSTVNELVMSPIIERNAIVPQSRERHYFTVQDDQALVNVNVYQGEHLRPAQNIFIGKIEVPVPKGKAGEQGIAVRFTYDVNGALEVEVTVISNREIIRKVFRNQSSLSQKELDQRFAQLAALKMYPREQQENLTLIARAERLYAEALGEPRQHIASLLHHFIAALDDQQMRDVQALRERFSKQLDAFDTEG